MDIQWRIDLIKNIIREKGFNLNPPVELKEIKSFEEEYKIQFPEEYREFMLKVGNGGDGPPHYRMLDLCSSIKLSKQFAKGFDEFLAEEFPLKEYMVWEGITLSEEDKQKFERIHRGSLILGEDGCGIFWLLIITGPERGQVWQLTEVGIQSCAPKLSFLDWYEYWLNDGRDWWRG